MKVTHFRIGNLVEEPKGHTHKIERLSIESDRVRHGIRITEKHLVALGFKINKYVPGYYFSKSCGKNKPVFESIFIYKDGSNQRPLFVYMNEYDNIKLIYVHQIQNLYFALTGKELEMDLKRLKKL